MKKLRINLIIIILIIATTSCNNKKDYASFDCSKFKESYQNGYGLGSICNPSNENDNCSCESFFKIQHYNCDECFCQGFNDAKSGKESKYPEKEPF